MEDSYDSSTPSHTALRIILSPSHPLAYWQRLSYALYILFHEVPAIRLCHREGLEAVILAGR